MKRTLGIDVFIALVLAMAIGIFMIDAIQKSNVIYLVFAGLAAIANFLHTICIGTKANNKK